MVAVVLSIATSTPRSRAARTISATSATSRFGFDGDSNQTSRAPECRHHDLANLNATRLTFGLGQAAGTVVGIAPDRQQVARPQRDAEDGGNRRNARSEQRRVPAFEFA
jgi:hypothetical protein